MMDASAVSTGLMVSYSVSTADCGSFCHLASTEKKRYMLFDTYRHLYFFLSHKSYICLNKASKKLYFQHEKPKYP